MELASATAAGAGPITFISGSAATLQIDAGDMPTQAIDGFIAGATGTGPTETIDVRGIGLATSAVVGPDDTLLLEGGSASATLPLDATTANIVSASNPGGSERVLLASDGAGGTDVTLQPRVFNFVVGSSNGASPYATYDQDAALFDVGGADAQSDDVYNVTNVGDNAGGLSSPINLAAGSVLNLNGGDGIPFTLQSGFVSINNLTLQNETDPLIIQGGTLDIGNDDHLAPSRGYVPYSPGVSVPDYANGIIIDGSPTIEFTPTAGQTDTVFGINDTTNGGAATILVDGAGTVVLGQQAPYVGNGQYDTLIGPAGPFTDPITIDEGTLEIDAAGAAGAGAITFAPGADATLAIDQTAQIFGIGNTIKGFAPGDVIRLDGLSSLTAGLSLSSDNGLSFDGVYLPLDPNQSFAGYVFRANYSPTYSTISLVALNQTVVDKSQLDAELAEVATTTGYSTNSSSAFTMTLGANFTGANALVNAATIVVPQPRLAHDRRRRPRTGGRKPRARQHSHAHRRGGTDDYDRRSPHGQRRAGRQRGRKGRAERREHVLGRRHGYIRHVGAGRPSCGGDWRAAAFERRRVDRRRRRLSGAGRGTDCEQFAGFPRHRAGRRDGHARQRVGGNRRRHDARGRDRRRVGVRRVGRDPRRGRADQFHGDQRSRPERGDLGYQ